jgi:uncharacterized protein
MSAKIIRDPLYNYVSIDRKRDEWLLELLDCAEFQRLRRIHQLGVSYLTYPGADHNRLSHSLGVLHVMQQVLGRLRQSYDDAQVDGARAPLLAAALIHDIGHGPFSHLFESCFGIDHEQWSIKITTSEETGAFRALRKFAPWLPRAVGELIDPSNEDHPSWQKYLLSSQLDVDRIDYLRRDSLFTGADYGHFDWYRLINTLEFFENDQSGRDIVWPEKSVLAIEEYIFSRYYMYQNVYLHKTTRGFEKIVEAVWERARYLFENGSDVNLIPAIRDFWQAAHPSVSQFLAIEEFTVLQQVQNWTSNPDKALSDLARRFLARKPLAMIEAPDFSGLLTPDYAEWEAALRERVGAHSEFDPPEMYIRADLVKAKHNEPYFPEQDKEEQSVPNAIRIKIDGERVPVEISKLRPRLRPLTDKPLSRIRYYVPKEVQNEARKLRDEWILPR